MQLLKEIEQSHAKNENVDHFDIGDTVDIHYWITEGDKRRIQIFTGLVIRAKHGRGVRGTFTVRRIVAGQGVERIFPFHSPNLEKVVVTRYGKPRRAKLYYLRDRIGKEALKVKELIGGRRKRIEDAEEKQKRVKKRGKKAREEKRKKQAAEGVDTKVKGKKKKKKRKAAKKRKSSDQGKKAE